METSKNTPKSEKEYSIPVICYPGHIRECSKISKTARNVLDIILIIMKIDNLVYLDRGAIYKIRQLSRATQGKNYTEQTIRNAIHELSKTDLLIKYRNKNYFVNPVYFMKFSPEERRSELITGLVKIGALKRE